MTKKLGKRELQRMRRAQNRDTSLSVVFDALREQEPKTVHQLALDTELELERTRHALRALRRQFAAAWTGEGTACKWLRVPGAKRPEDGRGMKPTSRANLKKGPHSYAIKYTGKSRNLPPKPATELERAWGWMPSTFSKVADEVEP